MQFQPIGYRKHRSRTYELMRLSKQNVELCTQYFFYCCKRCHIYIPYSEYAYLFKHTCKHNSWQQQIFSHWIYNLFQHHWCLFLKKIICCSCTQPVGLLVKYSSLNDYFILNNFCNPDFPKSEQKAKSVFSFVPFQSQVVEMQNAKTFSILKLKKLPNYSKNIIWVLLCFFNLDVF